MPSKDLHSRIDSITSLPNTTFITPGLHLGAPLSTVGLQSIEFMMIALTIGLGTWTLFMQDSDISDTGFVDVPQEFMLGTEAGTSLSFGGLSVTRMVGYIGHKLFVRPVLRAVGGTAQADMIIIAIVDGAIRNPINPNVTPSF